jgi:uncharacterized protein (TIGR00375 family)
MRKFYADLHIHSHYSYATSKFCTVENLHATALQKGISLLGTGDFTHPLWLNQLKNQLFPDGNGLLSLKNMPHSSVSFILSSEVSCIYRQDGQLKKIHVLLLAPDFETVERINTRLTKYGKLPSDGRPILKLSAASLAEIVLESSNTCQVIPAHIWTPWFGMLGAKSGFNSLNECFMDMAPYIHAVETGLSSDVPMNSRISFLEGKTLISCSDLHSPDKMARNATCFQGELSFDSVSNGLRTGSVSTIDLFPEEGKYYLDGHRKCGTYLTPSQNGRTPQRCGVCQKPLTQGVLSRNLALADQSSTTYRKFSYIIPLKEILADLFNCGSKTKKVEQAYQNCLTLASELPFLLELPVERINQLGIDNLGSAVDAVRKGKVRKKAGFDGQPGQITPII